MARDYSDVRDPYRVLEVPTNATDEEIKKVYRTKALKYHPDKFSKDPLSQEIEGKYFKEITEAYEILKDGRASYDNWLKNKTSSSTMSESTAEEVEAERKAQEEYDRKEAERKAEREKATTPPPFTSGTSSRSAYTRPPPHTSSTTSSYVPPIRRSKGRKRKAFQIFFLVLPFSVMGMLWYTSDYGIHHPNGFHEVTSSIPPVVAQDPIPYGITYHVK